MPIIPETENENVGEKKDKINRRGSLSDNIYIVSNVNYNNSSNDQTEAHSAQNTQIVSTFSEDKDDYFNPEEEVAIGSSKECNLPKEEVKSGEEEEELIFKMRGRIYRWRNNEWKERGTGEIKFLRHKTQKKIRFILRQDKTLKAAANFYISENPLCDLKPHQGSDKMFFFLAYDCSDETPVVEKFVIKLGNAENAKKFKENFEAAKLFNTKLKEGKESELVMAPVIPTDKEEKEAEKKEEEKKEEEKKEEKKEDEKK